MSAKSAQDFKKVWDTPTRLFHWSIVCLVAFSWFTADQGYMQAHFWSGFILLVLLLFRIAWGFFGSTTSRFSDFLQRPSVILRYCKALKRRERPRYAGHNPIGGLAVMAFLVILLAQAVTGLFSNDGVRFHGPLALEISSNASDNLSRWHRWLFNGVIALVWMHLVAVFFYFFVKNENLIRPMFNGKKIGRHLPPRPELEFTSNYRAVAIIAVVSGALAYLLL